VVARIARASAGLTRRVNLLGDKTLLAAFSESSHAVAPRHVKAAIRDSEFAQGGEVGNRHGWALVAAALAALLLAGGAWWLSTRQSPPALVIEPAPDRGAAPAADAPVPAASAVPPAADTTQAGPVATEAAAPPATAAALPATGPAAAADAAVSPQPPAAAPVPAATATVATVVPPAAVAPAAAGTATSSASPPGLLAERLAATSAWVRTAEPDRVTIQLMGSRSEDQLDRQLRSLSRQVNADRLFVIRTRAADRPLLTVFYGDFASRSEAQAALGALPEALRAFSPHLRTVQGIRNEITAAGS
jgi:septal ring-binding cell division protein DamX